MKRHIFGLLVILPFFSSAQLRFNKLFDYNKHWEGGLATRELNDGNFLAVVKTVGHEYADNKLIILRLNPSGDVLAQTEIFQEGYIYYAGLDCLKPMPDGAFLIGGAYKKISSNVTKACLIKIDTAGNIIWQKIYGCIGGSYSDLGDVLITPDNYIVFCGYSECSDGDGNIHVTKTTLDGTLIWERDIDKIGWQNAFQIAPTPDEGFVLATMSGSAAFTDYVVLKLDSLGHILWEKEVGGDYSDGFMPRISALEDGSCIFIGATGGPGEAWNAYAAKVSSDGKIEWQHNYPGEYNTSFFTRPIVLPDNSFIVSGGYSLKPDYSNGQLRIAKMNSDGELLWQTRHFYNPDKEHYGYAMTPTLGGGFIITGFTLDTTQDAWFLKTDSLGCLIDDCNTVGTTDPTIADIPGLSVYPNPASNWIQVTASESPILELFLYCIDGRLIQCLDIPLPQQAFKHQMFIGHLPAGVYRLAARTEAGLVQKIIVKSN